MTNSDINTFIHPIVFYDGLCGLCNKSVQAILKRDKKGKFYFATLQGDVAAEYLTDEQRKDLDSVVVRSRDRNFKESGAFFEIAATLGGWPGFFLVFSWLPSDFTDKVYRWIAKNRYKWFGKLDACPMPDPAPVMKALPSSNVSIYLLPVFRMASGATRFSAQPGWLTVMFVVGCLEPQRASIMLGSHVMMSGKANRMMTVTNSITTNQSAPRKTVGSGIFLSIPAMT